MVPHNRWVNRPEYEAAALRVLRSGHVGQGQEVERLEAALAARFGKQAACVVSSGTAALMLALHALYVQGREGSSVDVPTYACAALTDAAEALGLDVTFLDIDERTLNVRASEGPDYAPQGIFVHTYGVVGNCPGTWVEDFTHAPGGGYGGSSCGSMGALSVISFGATKPLGVGAGGAVLGSFGTIERIRDRRDYDRLRGDERFNLQLGDIYAALVLVRLERLEAENSWRNHVARRYDEKRTPVWTGTPHTFYRYVIRVADWREAQRHFLRYGVETINPLRMDELLHRRSSVRALPSAERVAATTLSLPIWPGMTDGEVKRVAEALESLS